MIRRKSISSNSNSLLKEEGKENTMFHTLASEIVGRAFLAGKLGLQYGGERDLYKALGYKDELTIEDFELRYSRQDIAKAIIDRPVNSTWQGALELVESKEPAETEFEKAWMKLDRRLKIKSRLTRLDKLVGIGEYGILVMGLNDIIDEVGWSKPVNISNKLKLLYIKSFGQSSAEIEEYEERPNNSRYGLPKYYTIKNIVDTKDKKNSEIKVHYTRIIHIVDDPLESEVKGSPRLQAVFNRLMDMEKVVGGDAEMFWRGARPGYQGVVDPNFQLTAEMESALKEQIDEYENNLRRIFVNEGVTLKELAQQIADPSNHVDVLLTLIASQTGIPKRILSGSERGELSSAQDSTEWKDYITGRRQDFAEPYIVRPVIDRFIELKILPKPKEDYDVKWSDLYALSEKARVEVGKGRANALREYTYNPIAMDIIPPNAFLEFFLGLSQEQITLILQMRDQVISEEELNKTVVEGAKVEQEPKEEEQEKSVDNE